jgi:pimeloyl-ACP methyl ester carboxylesterase
MPEARAVLLGWGNAARSQLVAYERLYGALGLEATSVIPDAGRGLVRADAHARALGPLARDLEDDPRGAIVHLFSDNGFLGWASLLAALAATEGGRRARDRIRGVVYDSAPGLWNAEGRVDFARRFALGMTPAVARRLRLGPRERVPIVTPLLGAAFLGYQLAFPSIVRSMRESGERVAREQPRCPHLFLFGEDDALVPPRDVRAWIAAERSAGLDVDDVAFPGARHVGLYPKDPRRYREAIAAFLRRVL